MNTTLLIEARRIAAALRASPLIDGHEESVEALAGICDFIAQRALDNASDQELKDHFRDLSLMMAAVKVGVMKDRAARAAGFSDSEGGEHD